MSPLEQWLECRLTSRSPAILHKAGIPLDGDVPELTATECQKWLGTLGHFAARKCGLRVCVCAGHSRLMLVLFLGPGYGRMEFQPFEAEVDPIELDVGPGTLLLVRSDGLAHRYFSTARSLALSCFILEENSSWRRRLQVPLLVTPCVRELMDWAKA